MQRHLLEHAGAGRVAERDLDDRDLVVGQRSVGVGRPAAAGVERGRERIGGDVDEHPVGVLGVEDELAIGAAAAGLAHRHHRVGVGAAIGGNRLEVGRRARVGDVEDPDALEAERLAGARQRRNGGLRIGLGVVNAVVVGPVGVDRGKQKPLALIGGPGVPDTEVVLNADTWEVDQSLGRAAVRDVDDLEAVVVSGVELVAPEGEIRVRRRALTQGGTRGDVGEMGGVQGRHGVGFSMTGQGRCGAG